MWLVVGMNANVPKCSAGEPRLVDPSQPENQRFLGNVVHSAFSVMNVHVLDIATSFARFTHAIHRADDGKMQHFINRPETNRTHLQQFIVSTDS